MYYGDDLLGEIAKRRQVVVVTGGRKYYPPVELLREAFRPWQVPSTFRDERYLPELLVLNGLALGLDSAVDMYCDVHEIRKGTFPAKWDVTDDSTGVVTKDKGAGHKRNQQMVDQADICLVFPGGSGTADCRDRALRAGLLVIDITE